MDNLILPFRLAEADYCIWYSSLAWDNIKGMASQPPTYIGLSFVTV